MHRLRCVPAGVPRQGDPAAGGSATGPDAVSRASGGVVSRHRLTRRRQRIRQTSGGSSRGGVTTARGQPIGENMTTVQTQSTRVPIENPDALYIGGQWVKPSTGAKIDVIAPATEQLYVSV